MLVSSKYSIGEFIRKFKSITARELFKKFGWLEKSFGAVNFGLMAIVGEGGNWSIVEKYIKEEGKDLETVQLRHL